MEDMKIQSSLYGHQPEILNDDHHIEMENIHFGVLSCRSQDDLLETSCQDNGENDQLSTADKTGNIEEGVSSATSAASSDDDPSPWRQDAGELSLSEVNGSIKIVDEDNASWFRKLLTFVGPGALVAVGYMDPGNWSTDIAGGSAFGFDLLCVILFSCLLAMFLQALSVKVGIATNRDLAQVCRDLYPQWLVYILWIAMEIAIMATDIAEVIGSAIALKLLFGIPLIGGVFITIVDVFLVLALQGKSFRITEFLVALLIVLIAVCFAVQIGMTKPPAGPLFAGFIPSASIFTNNKELFIAIGILGATVMPHNLFLHSSIILTREMRPDVESRKQYLRFAQIDSTVSLTGALFVNAAILIMAATTFYLNGEYYVDDISTAYQLLGPLVGNQAAQVLFGVSLLASGLNATLTGTFTGQIVMEGFTRWTISPVYRRFFTRLIAILPAAIAVSVGGDATANKLLIESQVILSFMLPFAVFPLAHVTSNVLIMKDFVNSMFVKILVFVLAFFLLGVNILLLAQS